MPPDNPFTPKSPVKARIYEFLARHPEGVTRDQIANYVNIYKDSAESPKTVTVHVLQMNRRELKAIGLKIFSSMGHGAVYKLRAL